VEGDRAHIRLPCRSVCSVEGDRIAWFPRREPGDVSGSRCHASYHRVTMCSLSPRDHKHVVARVLPYSGRGKAARVATLV
jgi:hypothetical protein